ncbi:MAG: TlpA family protein disulfide reductase [Deltaproteobacteria bacterium]|jgi:thiol-disulfide isomerase/thioredoxin|nr:TlpA family protein disulfide reductase [Deltaproteobacteria bacterium]
MIHKLFHGRFAGPLVGFTVALLFVPLFSVQTVSCAEEKGILDSLFKPGSKDISAIDFELQDLNGSDVRLSRFRGDRYVLLYFWATWCPYCLAVKPEIKKIRDRIGPKDIEVLAINVGGGDSLERLKKYQEGHPVPWPVLYDGKGGVTRAYQVQGIPLFILVDKEGKIVFRDNMLPQDITKYMK